MRFAPDELARALQGSDVQIVDERAILETPPRIMPGASERDVQANFFAVVDMRAVTDPRYRLVAALVNGQYRRGQRMEPGLRPGLPDIGIFWPREARDGCPAYNGAFIELKRAGGRVSDAQREWIERLGAAGYYTAICWGLQEALDVLDWYMN